MGMTEDDKRNCCLVEIQETEAKYYKTLEDIEKVNVGLRAFFVALETAPLEGEGDIDILDRDEMRWDRKRKRTGCH